MVGDKLYCGVISHEKTLHAAKGVTVFFEKGEESHYQNALDRNLRPSIRSHWSEEEMSAKKLTGMLNN